jgi:hypothetical protein
MINCQRKIELYSPRIRPSLCLTFRKMLAYSNGLEFLSVRRRLTNFPRL